MRNVSILAGMVLSFLSVAAYGQPPEKETGGADRTPLIAPFGHPGMHRGMDNAPPMIMDVAELQTLLKEIGIAPLTIEKVAGITRKFIADFDGQLIKVQREELNIKEELLREKPDLKVVQKYITEKSRFFSEIEFSQIKRDLEIKALLSRDEYEKLKSATMKKLKAMMPPGMQGEHRPGPEGHPAEGKPFHAK